MSTHSCHLDSLYLQFILNYNFHFYFNVKLSSPLLSIKLLLTLKASPFSSPFNLCNHPLLFYLILHGLSGKGINQKGNDESCMRNDLVFTPVVAL